MGLGIAALGREFTYRKIINGTIRATMIAYKAFLFTGKSFKIKNHRKVAMVSIAIKNYYNKNFLIFSARFYYNSICFRYTNRCSFFIKPVIFISQVLV